MENEPIFPDKSTVPTEQDIIDKIGPTYRFWQDIRDMVMKKYPDGKPEWNFPGKKYGWSFRIKDKKRAILYFLPKAGYFQVAFVFGDKALAEILESQIAKEIRDELRLARKYAEGRGVRIDVRSDEVLRDVERLIEVKLKF